MLNLETVLGAARAKDLIESMIEEACVILGMIKDRGCEKGVVWMGWFCD